MSHPFHVLTWEARGPASLAVNHQNQSWGDVTRASVVTRSLLEGRDSSQSTCSLSRPKTVTDTMDPAPPHTHKHEEQQNVQKSLHLGSELP